MMRTLEWTWIEIENEILASTQHSESSQIVINMSFIVAEFSCT